MLDVVKESYPVWSDYVLNVPLWANGASVSVSKNVIITNLVKAELLVDVRAILWPCIVKVYMNGSLVADYDFSLGAGTKSETFDVTSLLMDGSNSFVLDVDKASWIGWGDVKATVNLIVEGEVKVGPTIPKWLPYAALGVGMAVVGGVVLYFKSKR